MTKLAASSKRKAATSPPRKAASAKVPRGRGVKSLLADPATAKPTLADELLRLRCIADETYITSESKVEKKKTVDLSHQGHQDRSIARRLLDGDGMTSAWESFERLGLHGRVFNAAIWAARYTDEELRRPLDAEARKKAKQKVDSLRAAMEKVKQHMKGQASLAPGKMIGPFRHAGGSDYVVVGWTRESTSADALVLPWPAISLEEALDALIQSLDSHEDAQPLPALKKPGADVEDVDRLPALVRAFIRHFAAHICPPGLHPVPNAAIATVARAVCKHEVTPEDVRGQLKKKTARG